MIPLQQAADPVAQLMTARIPSWLGVFLAIFVRFVLGFGRNYLHGETFNRNKFGAIILVGLFFEIALFSTGYTPTADQLAALVTSYTGLTVIVQDGLKIVGRYLETHGYALSQ